MIYNDIWQSLEMTSPGHSFGYVVRRVKPESACDLFLAVAKPSNQHLLQIKLREASVTMAANLPSARGLDVTLVHAENEHSGFTIQLALREQHFNHVFDALISDVIEVIAHTQSESAAIRAFINRLRHWQKFLEQSGPDGLSKKAQQGLYGELWFLREKLMPVINPYSALLAWTGPGGTHQDFQSQSCAIEVKTTGTKEPQMLIIQSERQLDSIGLRALFLFHLSVYVREGTGESLSMIIESLRHLLKNNVAALEIYEDRLLEAGFHQLQASKYEKTGYTVRHTSLFNVQGSFPRIVESDLKTGIGSVQYSISSVACTPFEVTEEDFKTQLIGLNNGN